PGTRRRALRRRNACTISPCRRSRARWWRSCTRCWPRRRRPRGSRMHSAELVLALLIAVATLVTIARRLGIASPILLVIAGLLLGLVPGVPRIRIDPDLIFLLVLPPLLYVAAFFTPLRRLHANLGTIGSLAIGL